MKEIPLSNGEVVVVDDEDFTWLNRWRWKRHTSGHAARTVTGGDILLMHRQIMGDPKGMDVDHKNRNKLDNQRSNLRVTSHSLNGHNRPKQSNNTSGFKGVSWDKSRNLWRASIKFDGKHRTVGRFKTKDEAAAAYREAAVRLVGEFSCVD